MGLGIPPLKIKILLASNPLKSRILVRRLAVARGDGGGRWPGRAARGTTERLGEGALLSSKRLVLGCSAWGGGTAVVGLGIVTLLAVPAKKQSWIASEIRDPVFLSPSPGPATVCPHV